jgi:hypothetical protein
MEEIVIKVNSKVFRVLTSENAYIIYDQQQKLDEIFFKDGKWSSKNKMDDYLVHRLGYAIEKERKLK